jgi:hypothetical protein
MEKHCRQLTGQRIPLLNAVIIAFDGNNGKALI